MPGAGIEINCNTIVAYLTAYKTALFYFAHSFKNLIENEKDQCHHYCYFIYHSNGKCAGCQAQLGIQRKKIEGQ
jgi:hypothetical protein